jgi:hypothetical protein
MNEQDRRNASLRQHIEDLMRAAPGACEHVTLEGCAGLLSVATDNCAPRLAVSWDVDAVGQDVWRMWRTEKVAK